MKERLDLILTEKGLAPSREKAKALIMAGEVYVDGEKEDKPGTSFDPEKVNIEVRSRQLKYVSRGGFKLEKAMQVWGFDLTDKVCMDIGSSTGGFTDCMLQNGASKVYSVDVGRGQLDWKLRNDDRVVVMEQTNFRFLTPDDIPEKIDFASVDVSFISLDKILIPARNLLKDGGRIVALIKPQFEAGKGKVGKNGVVRDISVHEEVIARTISFADYVGFEVLGIDFSPIKGPEGNIEYLMNLVKKDSVPGEILSMNEKEAIESFETANSEGRVLASAEEWKSRISLLAGMSHTELAK
ncbi:MAG: TlyA family RNA methyltransferase [Lachnospiraceae bacterium]|nr:TlyA family RNA methyltransferase [Lachnospiraceae bacterium]